MARTLHLLFCCLAWIAVVPCAWSDALDDVEEEQDHRVRFASSTITLTSEIRNGQGQTIQDASVELQSMAGDLIAKLSDTPNGSFTLLDLPRKNALLAIDAPGYRSRIIPVFLRQPLSQSEESLDTIVLTPVKDRTVRFLFGGDSSFGRRFLGWDPLPTDIAARYRYPPDNADAYVLASDPLPGARKVVQFLRPLFLTADYPTINLESVVTDFPISPHTNKDFVYYTLPQTLGALKELGVDYVSLGNNHTYDYLAHGVTDTMRHLDEIGLAYSGLGNNEDEAAQPYREDSSRVQGHLYSFISMNSVSGTKSPPIYNATTEKGGAAPLRDSLITKTVDTELEAGRIPIALLHSGKEYTFAPTNYTRNRLVHAARSGVAFVIAHHPHVAQGFGYEDGILVAHSLGNLFFDQARLETMYGLLTQIDADGFNVDQAVGIPVYNEDFRPRMITGAAASNFLRRISEFSDSSARVYPYLGEAQILPIDNPSTIAVDRDVVINASIPESGWTVVDLRQHAKLEESLHSVRSSKDIRARPGRDALIGGDFEDYDIDHDEGEVSRWSYSDLSGLPVGFETYRGATAMASVRNSAGSGADSVIAYRNRTRVIGDATNTPNKSLTLYGATYGDNAGIATIISRYYASAGEQQFGEEIAYSRAGGTYPWTVFMSDLNMPADADDEGADHATQSARALRLFIRHAQPDSGGRGLAIFDDLAVINWEEFLTPTDSPSILATPHARDFLRVEGSPSSEIVLRLQFRRYLPQAAAQRTSMVISLE